MEKFQNLLSEVCEKDNFVYDKIDMKLKYFLL